jgi:hypothetical protein
MCGSLWLDEAPVAAHLADWSDASDITHREGETDRVGDAFTEGTSGAERDVSERMETRGVRTVRQADGSRLGHDACRMRACTVASRRHDKCDGARQASGHAATREKTRALANVDASGGIRTNTSAGSGAVSVLPQHNVMKGDAYPLHAR